MIKPKQAVRGLVFRDPMIPTARQFFRLADKLENGSWRAEQVTNRRLKATQTYTEKDLERLLPVPSAPVVESNLDNLLGQHVVLKTTFGRSSGLVTLIEVKEITIFGERYENPVALILGADRYELQHIEQIEVRHGRE